jgi:acyl-CoA thioesterase YciA
MAMELITTKTILALDIGVNDNLFGGIMLSELDKAGAAYAAQLCDSPRLVTKKFEEVVFEKPCKIGNLIKIYGEVVKFGNTSITIKLEARKHQVETGTQQIVCSTTVVFVKINDEGDPIPISDRVKTRYAERFKKFKRGLLTPEELENS